MAAANGSGVEMAAFKRSGNNIQDARRVYLSSLRKIRKRGAALAGIPKAAITHLDAAVEIVKKRSLKPRLNSLQNVNDR
jgi:hypothetical protein